MCTGYCCHPVVSTTWHCEYDDNNSRPCRESWNSRAWVLRVGSRYLMCPLFSSEPHTRILHDVTSWNRSSTKCMESQLPVLKAWVISSARSSSSQCLTLNRNRHHVLLHYYQKQKLEPYPRYNRIETRTRSLRMEVNPDPLQLDSASIIESIRSTAGLTLVTFDMWHRSQMESSGERIKNDILKKAGNIKLGRR